MKVETICQWLQAHLPGKEILRRDVVFEPHPPDSDRYGLGGRMRTDEAVYLRRTFLFRSKWLSIFLHQFCGADPDGLHDHPWNFISIPLTRDFYETTFDGDTIRRPWRPYWKRAEEFHRIHLGPEACVRAGRVWTLFIHFRRRRAWGFLDKAYESNYRVADASDYRLARTLWPNKVWRFRAR